MAELIEITSLRAPARVCASPASLGSAFPHGGTDLGEALRIEFSPGQSRIPITKEEHGGEPLDWIVRHENPLLLLLFRGAHNAMVSKIFAASSTGGSTGTTRGSAPDSPGKGRLASARAFSLLVSPRDTTRFPGLILYAALPLWDETARMQWMVSQEIGVPAAFRAIRDGAGRLYQLARLGDMAL